MRGDPCRLVPDVRVASVPVNPVQEIFLVYFNLYPNMEIRA